jgi:hypothetical protein
MNTYRNRRKGNPWHGVKPARAVTPEQSEATRMALQIRDLCGQRIFETFMRMRQAGTPLAVLREYHQLVTDTAIAAEEAMTADWREDQADRLAMSRGQF